jgi:hypothetical protein
VVSFELTVGGRDSAACIAVVDDVVVNQGGSVKKFQSRRKINNSMLVGVSVGINRDIAKGYGCAPAPIGKASTKSFSAVQERFGYRR